MGRMRLMVFSVLFHGAVFGLALMGGKENAKRKATALAMADQEKKKAPEKKADAPKPEEKKPEEVKAADPAAGGAAAPAAPAEPAK